MRYLGGKTAMLQHILDVAHSHAKGSVTVADLFAGTGVVANAFKNAGYGVTANDQLYFSYVLNKGTLVVINLTARNISQRTDINGCAIGVEQLLICAEHIKQNTLTRQQFLSMLNKNDELKLPAG